MGQRLSRPAMMLTFEPMPREYLARGQSAGAAHVVARTLARAAAHGARLVLQLRFGEQLRSLTGEEFARLLARDLKAPAVVVGHDFRFGRNGEANAAACCSEAGRRLGFDGRCGAAGAARRRAREQQRDPRRAGSGATCEQAARLLGRPYSMIGRVVRGQQLGRTSGFPPRTCGSAESARRCTASSRCGCMACAARPHAPGVASLGTRPTVGGTVPLLEAHVFDFDGDLYGREIEVEFVAKLREERALREPRRAGGADASRCRAGARAS